MSLWQKKVYPILPVIAQNLAISAYGLQWHHRRFGGIFNDELKKFKDREFYSELQWKAYQTIELRKLLLHSFKNVKFYHEKYAKEGFKESDFRKFEIEDLRKLPYLEKEELRNFGTSDLLSVSREKNGQFFSSSGSTGTPTRILFSNNFHRRWSAAFEARIRHWAGVDRHDPRGMIGGRRVVPTGNASPPFYRYNCAERQVYFSAYHISETNVGNYLMAISKYKLEYMTGYAMSNFFLAKMINDQSLCPPQLKAVITSSEKLTNNMRETISKVYGCKVFDSYSGVEACGLISESEKGEMLISPDVGIVEVINSVGEYVPPGGTGEVVSTGLLNYDQPLIRYRIGDEITLSESQTTKCGRNMSIVKEINGRVEDKVIGPDGRQMVRFHGIYVDILGLVAAQLVQLDRNTFHINLVVDSLYNITSESIISSRLRSQLGEVKVEYHYLQEIPKNKNGKFKAVVSKLGEEK